MAEERIQLTLGGKYTASDAFAQGNKDIKNFQNATKDMTGAVRSSLGTVAKSFDGELGDSINKATNLLGQFAHGGLWGVIAAGVTTAIGYAVEKFNEAREAAAKYAEILRNEVVQSITAISEKFKSTSEQINKTKSDAKDMMDVLNGEVANNAQLKIHQLHIETLQKITDDMSKAGKDLILADESYQAACIKSAAAIEAVENATKTSKDALQASTDKRVAAEEALTGITKEREQLESLMMDNGRGWLAERQKIQDNMAKNEQMYADGMIDQATYIKFRKDLSVQLSKLEEEHKDELTQLNNVKKAEKEATKAVETEKNNEAAAQKAVTLAMQKEESVRIQAAQAEMDAEQKLKAAVDAMAETGKAATEKRAAAEEALAKATADREKVELEMFDYGKGWLAEKKKLEEDIAKNEQLYKDGLISHTEMVKNRKELAVKIAEIESKHKDDLTKLNDAIANETKASEKVNEARQKEEEALKAVTDIKVSSAKVQEQANVKIEAASNAIAAEAEAIQKAQKAADDKAYMDAQAAYILEVCTKRQVEAADYIQLFTQMIANGASETDAYAELQKKLNEEVKKRTDAESNLTDVLKEDTTTRKTKDGKAVAVAHVSIDPKEIGQGVQEWDGKTTWHNLREKMSDDVKQEHQEAKQMRAEMLPFTQLLKGNMTKQFAEEYKNALAKDYSKEQLTEMYKNALKSQLLSTSEQREQFKTFKSILKCMENQGLK